MKVGGIEFKSSAWEPEPLVLDRGRDENGNAVFLVLRAQGLKDFEEFELQCPKPENQAGMLTRDGGWVEDPESPAFLDELQTWRDKRWNFTIIHTLKPSNIQWEKVQMSVPKTWQFVHEELRKLLNYVEVGHVMDMVNIANAIDSDKLEENRLTFFQLQAESASRQIGPDSDPQNSQSGEPA